MATTLTGRTGVRIHPTAEVAASAEVGPGTSIWHQCHVREGARIGRGCVLGKDVYVDFGVWIGDNVKVQNRALVYHGVTVESGAFIGPGVILANDRLPRAINADGSLKRDGDWEVGTIHVGYGASLGAGAIVLPGVAVGRFALVGAGSVVTRDVPDHGLVVGNPARLVGYVCRCASRLARQPDGRYLCPRCGELYERSSRPGSERGSGTSVTSARSGSLTAATTTEPCGG